MVFFIEVQKFVGGFSGTFLSLQSSCELIRLVEFAPPLYLSA